MKLIAQKPCSFGGRKFFIGDEIPTELVLDPKGQEKMGVLAFSGAEGTVAPVAGFVTITVTTEGGNMPLDVTIEGLQAVFSVLTGKTGDAEAVIAEMADPDALILLHMAEGRKAVKEMAKSRAKKLEAGEQ